MRDLTFSGRRIELKEVPEVLEGLLKASENYGSIIKEAGLFGWVGGSGSTVASLLMKHRCRRQTPTLSALSDGL